MSINTRILITNLGTPDEPTPSAVRRYLREFLSDHGIPKRSVDLGDPYAEQCYETAQLETLEEMAIQNREIFLEAGGNELNYIPALNNSPAHLHALAKILNPLF